MEASQNLKDSDLNLLFISLRINVIFDEDCQKGNVSFGIFVDEFVNVIVLY